MQISRREFIAGAAAASLLVSAGLAQAEGFKLEGNATFVLGTGAGGGGDLFARAAAAGIGAAAGINISVENRTGGGGVIADSYVLSHTGQANVLSFHSNLILIPYAMNPPPNYTWKSFTPIVELGEDQQVLIVPAGSPFQSLSDLIAAAKEKPKYIRASGSSAAGTALALTRLLAQREGVEFQEVVLTSGSESVARMLGGDVDFSMLNPSEALGQLQAGTLRALAVFADRRYPDGSGLEDIPTAVEQGVDLTFAQWRGILGPAGMTDEQVTFWVDAAKVWSETPEYKDYISKNYLFPAFRARDDFAAMLQREDDKMAGVLGKGK